MPKCIPTSPPYLASIVLLSFVAAGCQSQFDRDAMEEPLQSHSVAHSEPHTAEWNYGAFRFKGGEAPAGSEPKDLAPFVIDPSTSFEPKPGQRLLVDIPVRRG